MRIVVTGGAGFIGANLVRRLVSDTRFSEVTVLDDLSTGSRENLLGVPCQLEIGSVLDASVLDRVFDQADGIVHLAARPSVPRSIADPLASHHANATGTLMVLEAARGAENPHVIVASSSSVYGANPALPKSESLRTEPLSPYAVSKQATESYALAYAHCFDLPVLALRFFNVFGPLQSAGHAYAAVIPTFIDAALAGRPLPIDGDGEQSRDFTYVGSVAHAIIEALVGSVTCRDPVNLAFGSRLTLLEAVRELEGILGRALERDHRPPRPGDVRHSQADGSRLRSILPTIEQVPFTAGLRDTISWFEATTSSSCS